MSNLKEHFLAEVLQYIKSREAKKVVYKELSYHLKMSKLELVTRGYNENEAEEKAIKKMGSPKEIGTHFNKLYRPKFDWKLFGLFIIIILIGILPTLNVQDRYSENLFLKQMIYIAVGIIVAISVMLVDYRKMMRFGWFFLIAAISLLLVLNLFPNLVINGVSYIYVINGVPYIHIFGFTISGSSLLPLFLIFWAYYFSKVKPKLFVIIGVYLLTVLLFLGLPSFSVVFIYSILVLALFCCSSISKKVIYTTIGVYSGVVLTFFTIYWFTVESYLKIRLLAFFNPDDYPINEGFAYLVLKDLLSGGGWFGNQEPPKYIGIITPDMAFANITYFYGWILSGFLFAVLSLLLFRLIVVSTQIKDRFGKQLILGVCSLLSIQFVYNIGMVLGFLPILSMSLPFISYGLTPTVLNSLLIGIVLSVYRRKHLAIN
ncbi:FtsW/RodA/SpoVE family cell cycle protein [Bacillus sp. USDA818B3_A]|uniref:FtsW/RodA/SpoVE family cell cycle protein n=1 Tax=Bacillus sp. USDA818B3_A TaxID=2698834 RepID=UPI00136A847E|nr:FtsW/RodA/SpoVE family cell cycle protein [Bacillus sp. USDA818B3_A]